MIGKYTIPGGSYDDHEKIEVLQEYVHPDFDYSQRTYDQMILKLAQPSSRPLVNINLNPTIPQINSRITVVGLGRLQYGGSKPDVLQQVTLDYISNDECAQASNYMFSYQEEIYDDMICLISDNPSSKDEGQCNGDSGGPYLLLGNTPADDVQVGMVSWGLRCAYEDFPGVGSRTTASDFITRTTCDIASDPPPYLCGGGHNEPPAPPPVGGLAPPTTPAYAPTPQYIPPTKAPTTTEPTKAPTKAPTTNEPTESPTRDCTALYDTCASHTDCCSGRCVSNICRTSPNSGGGKQSIGGGGRGGAGGKKKLRHQRTLRGGR